MGLMQRPSVRACARVSVNIFKHDYLLDRTQFCFGLGRALGYGPDGVRTMVSMAIDILYMFIRGEMLWPL